MKYWRMSFRWGSQGPQIWPYCFKQGIAAMGYYEWNDEPIVSDCTKITEEEFDQIWRDKGISAPTSQGSLKKLAYRMKENDVIYVKEGPYIVGKGCITREYQYKPNVLNLKGILWDHYVKVDWENNFTKFKLDLGANQHTVLELNEERLKLIRENESQEIKKVEIKEAEEGEQYTFEATFRKRNEGLIYAKKSMSDYCCEVCGLNFEEVYGKIGKEYIIAHHKNPIGTRKISSKTTMEDIALVCSNCHDMLHRQNPPLSIEELREKIQRNKKQ